MIQRAARGELRASILRELDRKDQTAEALTHSIYGCWDEKWWQSIQVTLRNLEKSGEVVRDRSTRPALARRSSCGDGAL